MVYLTRGSVTADRIRHHVHHKIDEFEARKRRRAQRHDHAAAAALLGVERAHRRPG
jgi:hypothetical protein